MPTALAKMCVDRGFRDPKHGCYLSYRAVRVVGFEIQESIGETAIVIEAQNIEGVTPFYPDGVETLARRFMNTSNE